MQQELPTDAEVEGWLKTLDVDSLCQWDVLVFLYRHQTTLVSADHLARLLGHATEPVVAALDVLESRELVQRSRVSQGARLYQFTAPTKPPTDDAFERLLALAGHRAGRLLLAKQSRRGDQPPQEQLQAARQRDQERDERKATWRKVI